MRSEQLIQFDTYLLQAKQKAAAADWLETSYYLQNSPIFASKSEFQQASRQQQDLGIELALATLVQGEFQQKWDIAKIFSIIGIDIVPPLIDLLESEAADIETKWFAARALGNFKEQKAIIALARLLKDAQDEELIAIAAKSLVKIGNPAIEILVSLLDYPESRLIAAKSLAHIRLSPALPALVQLAQDPNPEIRHLAIEALGSFHHQQVPPILIQALRDTHSSVRKEAVVALGFCRDLCQTLDLVNHLQPLLYDFNSEVCRQTAVSLARMNDTAAVETLAQALRSPDMPLDLKIHLVRALAWSELALALDYLQDALKTETEVVLCKEIIVVLGRIRQSELKPLAVHILLQFWQTHQAEQIDSEPKKALATALGELKAIEGQTVLEQLAQDRVKIVRLYALSSLKKLSSKH